MIDKFDTIIESLEKRDTLIISDKTFSNEIILDEFD